MRKLYLTFLYVVFAAAAFAQSETFTLEQCIEYALTNNLNVQSAQLDESSAAHRVKEITGVGLPQITSSFNMMHNQKLARFFSAYSQNSPFFKDVVIPGVNEGDVIASQNFFQLKGNASAAVNISEDLSASYFIGLKAARALKDLSFKTTNQSRVITVESVTKAFYLALVNQERIKLFNTNISRIDTLLRNTKALNQNGFAEIIDVDRLQVTYNNLVTEQEKFINLQALSIELLKFQMNFPMEKNLAIAGEISSANPTISLDSYNKDWDYTARPDYQIMEVNHQLQGYNIKNNQYRIFPTLGLFANIGYTTQSPTIGGLFTTNTSINDNGLIGPDKWYSYTNYGLALNLPIFGGFQLKHKVQQEKLTLLKIENGMKQMKSGIDLEIKNSMLTYQNAIKSMQSQKQNMELSSKIARVTKIKYEQGVGSNIEVLEAESSLKESQVNYYNALYDALIAKVNLDKAYGKLLPENKQN